jgi:cytochrome b
MTPPPLPGPETEVRVWDGALRLFHWLLVAAVAVSLLTGLLAPRTWLRVHLISGTSIATLLGFRLVWGVLGGTHARFAAFAFPPGVVLRQLRALAAGGAPRHLGHNPVGSMMIFGLLFVLAALVGTGVTALGGVVKQGPLRALADFATGSAALRVHWYLAVLLACMVAAHLAGVALESRRTAENLVRSMLTGRKRAGGIDARPVAARPALAAAIVAGGVAAGTAGIAGLARLPAWGVPPATLDATYALQCGACHLAYPPSFSPIATWSGILGDLQHHFGADASLSPEQIAAIRAYLLANSAEHWDTLPGHRFRRTDPAEPLRITATPFWRRMHRDIPDAIFASPRVVRRSACAACHRDAETGRFAPQAIEVPAVR